MKILKTKAHCFVGGKFRIDIASLRATSSSGEVSEFERLNFVRGDSAAVLVHDTDKDEVILARQFRYPVTANARTRGDGSILELPAGIIETGEAPQTSAAREVEEEVGYAVAALEPIASFFPSPGACSEKIDLFYAPVSGPPASAGGGVADENEEIEIIRLAVAEFLAMAKDGRLMDGKTLLAAWWLAGRTS